MQLVKAARAEGGRALGGVWQGLSQRSGGKQEHLIGMHQRRSGQIGVNESCGNRAKQYVAGKVRLQLSEGHPGVILYRRHKLVLERLSSLLPSVQQVIF